MLLLSLSSLTMLISCRLIETTNVENYYEDDKLYVRKCCPFNEEFTTKKKCVKSNYTKFLEDVQGILNGNLSDYRFRFDYKCPGVKDDLYMLEEDAGDRYRVEGTDLLWYSPTGTIKYLVNEYCVDSIDSDFIAFYCYKRKPPNKYQTGKIILLF